MKKSKHTDSSMLGRKLRDRLQARYPKLMDQMAGCLAHEAETGFGGPRRWIYTIRRGEVEYGRYKEVIAADTMDEAIDKFAAACAAARLTGKGRIDPNQLQLLSDQMDALAYSIMSQKVVRP